MRSAVAAIAGLVVVSLGHVAAAQAKPLRKSDPIRHLSSSALTTAELADLIRRNCVSFTPTDRDRADLRALGADDGVMRSIDGCLRRGATVATPPPAPAAARVQRAPSAARPAAPVPTATPRPAAPPPPVVRAPAVVSASRTGFIAGVGQRGRVGTRLRQPLIFEVRDTANAPVVGRAVVFLAAGASLQEVRATTDSDGLA